MTASPVLFIIFNRPETTKVVFETIRKAQPAKLYIAADGPRHVKTGEYERCQAARNIAINVDWECDVQLLFRDTNLGCKVAVSSAIDWFFENVEEGIILEDDCVPDISFFRYCDELLAYYRSDERIMHIGGNNFQFGRTRGNGSYYFSHYNHIWGWASWRRAWKHYDVEMKAFPEFLEQNKIKDIFDSEEHSNYWLKIFFATYQGKVNTWDYQWTFAVWEQNGLSIAPQNNLISNIGFGSESTHQLDVNSPLANIKTQPMICIQHPVGQIAANVEADNFTTEYIFMGKISSDIIENLSQPPAEAQRLIAEMTSELNNGKIIQALRISEKVVAEYSITIPGFHYSRALCLNTVGRHEEAFDALKLELAVNPENTEAVALYSKLQQAIIRQERPQIPIAQRSWHTSLPRETLLELQNVGHNYTWRGVPMIKNPFDFALYPLLVWDLKPRTIIEIGSKNGGSALWLGDMLNNFGIDGHIYSLDIVGVRNVSHSHVTFLEGDGRNLEEAFSQEFMLTIPRPLLVIEDADHSYETSSHVLSFFDQYLAKGEYIVIEDGIISDLSQVPDCNSGPHLALKEFLGNNMGAYEIDAKYCDYFGYNVTWCTNGFLTKVVENQPLRVDTAPEQLITIAKPRKYLVNHMLSPALINEFYQDDSVQYGIVSQMSVNERFQLYYAVRKLLSRKQTLLRFIEIGSYSGASLVLICKGLMRFGGAYQGISVEPGGTAQFHEVISHMENSVIHMPMLSHEAAQRLGAMFSAENLPNFIFIDGDHSYDGVKQDIIDYYPLLAPGGIMLFHDYLPELDECNRGAIFYHHGGKEPGIRRACKEVLEDAYRLSPLELPLLYPVDPTQTQAHLPIIPRVFSTVRAYRKPLV